MEYIRHFLLIVIYYTTMSATLSCLLEHVQNVVQYGQLLRLRFKKSEPAVAFFHLKT